MKVKNSPYWYDNTAVVFTPMTGDNDVPLLSVSTELAGTFTAPGRDDFYKGLDRISQLSNANYKPNNPNAFGSMYMTVSTYAEQLAESSVASANFTYADINASMATIYDRSGVSITKQTFVPVSVRVAYNETLGREYYLECHVTPERHYDVSTGWSYTMSFIWKFRIQDTDTGVAAFETIRSVAGWTVFEVASVNYDHYVYFYHWYDPETGRLVYQGRSSRFATSSIVDPTHPIIKANSNPTTDSGHTFYGTTQQRDTLDATSAFIWESDVYKYYNPANTIDYDALIDDMGPFGPESDKEGYPTDNPEGHGDDTSDTIGIPDDPLIGVTNVGFVNVYKTGVSSLQDIGVELFPDLQYNNPAPISGSADVIESIENGFNSIITALANIPSIVAQQVAATLINYIIDCHVLPVTPTGGTPENIKVGYKTLNATGDRLSTDYVPFDCGTIKLGEYYGSFADFMTGAKLFLPFVGFVPARPEWFYADTLGVQYKFNVIDGSFVCYVTSTGKYVNNNGGSGTVVAQYSGNACVHLPITGVTYASMVSGLVGAGAGAVASAGSGNIPGVASSVTNAASVSGDIPQSNAYASSGAFLSVRRPYLMIERPVTNYSPTFRKERGLPSNISRKLQNMSGFTILQDVHLDGIAATDAEKKELEALLSKGVIF